MSFFKLSTFPHERIGSHYVPIQLYISIGTLFGHIFPYSVLTTYMFTQLYETFRQLISQARK